MAGRRTTRPKRGQVWRSTRSSTPPSDRVVTKVVDGYVFLHTFGSPFTGAVGSRLDYKTGSIPRHVFTGRYRKVPEGL